MGGGDVGGGVGLLVKVDDAADVEPIEAKDDKCRVV